MGDRVIRAITIDGSFRVIAVRTTELVRAATAKQEVTGNDARVFGELLTGAVLVRETMAPMHRLQMVLARTERGQMLADSHPDEGVGGSLTRGLVNRIGTAAMSELLGEGAVLKVMRSLPGGKLHQSIVDASAGDTSRALMTYMQESEQVLATLLVSTVMDGDRVVAAGGFVVQVLPEIAEGPLAVMTERLAHDFASIDDFILKHDDARVLKDELLYGMPHEELFDGVVHNGCDCSEARVLSAIATLGREEIEQIITQGEVMSLTCEYCRTPWVLTAERLRSLLDPN